MRRIIFLIIFLIICIAGLGFATNTPPFDIQHIVLRVGLAL